MTSNFTLVDGLGLELRIFNLTHQKRSEAKVDLGGHFKNKSKCTFVDGLGLELRIFYLTHQKRSEAKNDLKGHFKNMSKSLQIYISGWFEVGIENIQSDPSKEVRGQS